jgi:hypothetical protein
MDGVRKKSIDTIINPDTAIKGRSPIPVLVKSSD